MSRIECSKEIKGSLHPPKAAPQLQVKHDMPSGYRDTNYLPAAQAARRQNRPVRKEKSLSWFLPF